MDRPEPGPGFELIACPLCGSRKYAIRMHVPDRFDLIEGRAYRIVTCEECNFVYLNPRPIPETVARFYQHEAYQPFLSATRNANLLDVVYKLVRTFTVRRKRRIIEKGQPRGRILDVGCGTGEFLHEMQEKGWRCVGIEKDQAAATFARDRYGLEVHGRDLDEFQDDEKFQAITFWHVLEHLFDPKASLNFVAELLSRDGLLALALPNVDSLDAKFYSENWVALDAPRHLHHFTPSTLAGLCRDLNLTLIDYRQMIPDAYFNCLMSEELILSKIPRRRAVFPIFWLRAVLLATASVVFSTRMRKSPNRRGSSILYLIRKKS